jgi:hypothetical protein
MKDRVDDLCAAFRYGKISRIKDAEELIGELATHCIFRVLMGAKMIRLDGVGGDRNLKIGGKRQRQRHAKRNYRQPWRHPLG